MPELICTEGPITTFTSLDSQGISSDIIFARISPNLCLNTDVKLVTDQTVESGTTWSIYRYTTSSKTLIASSSAPNGWEVQTVDDDFKVLFCAPSNAQIGDNYVLVIKDQEQIRRTYFLVVPNEETDCSNIIIPSPTIISTTNCSVTIKIPQIVSGVLFYKLYYTNNLSQSINDWTQYSDSVLPDQEITINNLVENNSYYFMVIGHTLNGKVNSMPSIGLTSNNPVTGSVETNYIGDDFITIDWPFISPCNIETRFFYRKKGDPTYSSMLYTGECNNRLTNLLPSTGYESYIGILYPGNNQQNSTIFSFDTLMSTITQPDIVSISSDYVVTSLLTFKSDWKRVDLLLKNNTTNDWEIIKSSNSSIQFNIDNLTPSTEYQIKYKIYSDTENRESYITTFKTSSVSGLGEIYNPDLAGFVAVNEIGLNSVKLTVPTLRSDTSSMKIIYTDDLNKPYDQWTVIGPFSEGQTHLLSGLISDKDYWVAILSENSIGGTIGRTRRFATLCELPGNNIIGTPPLVNSQDVNFGSIRIFAPDLSEWPNNTSYLVLEAKEKTEDSSAPDTNLWFTVKNNIHIGDTFIIDDSILKNCMNYDFRWVARS